MSLHPKTVVWNFTPSPFTSDWVVTIKDAATSVAVPGLDRKSSGHTGSLAVQLDPGTYVAVVEAVNLSPDPGNPAYSDPAASAPFTVVDLNTKPPAVTNVAVND